MTDPTLSAITPEEPVPAGREVSGKLVVIGMFLFGLTMTGLMYLYWDLHTRPFRPLQEAINAAMPGSLPRVIGGRYKSHRDNSPNTLRIVVRVPFDPEAQENDAERNRIAKQLATLAAEHHDVRPYDEVEIHLVHRVAEQATQQWEVSHSPAEWEAVQPDSAIATPAPGGA
jgi:hypothetical protein